MSLRIERSSEAGTIIRLKKQKTKAGVSGYWAGENPDEYTVEPNNGLVFIGVKTGPEIPDAMFAAQAYERGGGRVNW